jgi:hypothetical protein
MAARINREAAARLLRLRGFSRLSPWFAVGFTFRETAGWVLESDQYGTRWRTDAPASDIGIVVTDEPASGPPTAVAVAVSITGNAKPAVERYLKGAGDPVCRLVCVSVETAGRDAIRGAGDLTAIADAVRNAVLTLDDRPDDVLLFYWGPAAGAVFIGHGLNGIAPKIHLFEEEFGTYIPSITLS